MNSPDLLLSLKPVIDTFRVLSIPYLLRQAFEDAGCPFAEA
jgi:hypothetical protein